MTDKDLDDAGGWTGSRRTGVLAVTVWEERSDRAALLRARVIRSVDVRSAPPVVTTLVGAEHVFAEVRSWLEEFTSSRA